jgi:aspartyl-tRNA(Asn)/glutamyl-tRNA(Gln) amidotransferase subunit A
MDGNVQGLKLGLPREYLKSLTSETGDSIEAAVATLRKLGCDVREISLPATEYAIGCYYIIATAEASSNLARYDGVRYTSRSEASTTLSDMYRHTRGEGFGAECKRRIMLGTYVLSAGYYDAYYLKAQKVRALIARDFARSWRLYRPSRRLSWEKRSTIRWPCTYPTFTRLPARWPAFPA